MSMNLQRHKFDNLWRNAVVDSNSISPGETDITYAEPLQMLWKQSGIDAEHLQISEIGKPVYIDDKYYESELQDRRV